LIYEYTLRPAFHSRTTLGGELRTIMGREADPAIPDSLNKELREDIMKESVHAA
jgi:predicted nucleotidyltransferase